MYSLLAFQKSLGEAARGYRNVIGLEACSVGGCQLTFVESLCVSHWAREHIHCYYTKYIQNILIRKGNGVLLWDLS